MKRQLADITTNTAEKLTGFKVLGVFPFHLKYITTRTHIKLAKLRAQMQALYSEGEEPTLDDFYKPELQGKILPLMEGYCLTGLLNDRQFSWLLKPFLQRKLKRCAHQHLLSLFATIMQKNEPAFFLAYWKPLMTTDNTLLKEEIQ